MSAFNCSRLNADQIIGITVGRRNDDNTLRPLNADELSEDSVLKLRALIAAQWSALFDGLVPALEGLIADDKAQGRPQDQRTRIGFYSYTQPMDKRPTAL